MEPVKYHELAGDMPTGHKLLSTDPDSPMLWPLWKKAYTCSVAFAYVFVIVYGTTTYSAAVPFIPAAFNTSQRLAIVGFTLPFFGVFLAPILTPHVAERFGRRPIYLASISLFSLCVVGIGLATDISTLLAFRFLAGLCGGPCLVLIEGTFADIWPAKHTVTYYSALTMASFLGAAFGPIIGNFVLTSKGAPWLSWVTLMGAFSSLAWGAAMPETYSREIIRERLRYSRSWESLPAAQSGETFSEMLWTTAVTPFKMLFTEPIVLSISLYLGLNFAVVFQWFISIPVALQQTYDFTSRQVGLAYASAVGGALLAFLSSSLIERFMGRCTQGCPNTGISVVPLERRLIPAMAGGVMASASLFWVGFAVSPNVSPAVPIIGNGVYVWGNAMVLISLISYLFDAYPPAGTLSALTAAACFRLLCAGIVPIYILDMIENLPNGWAFGTFGIISALLLAVPAFLFLAGPHLRRHSLYSGNFITVAHMETIADERSNSVSSRA